MGEWGGGRSNLQFSGHKFIYKQSYGDLTLAQFLKTCYNSSKTAGFPLQVFKNSSLEVSEKSEIVATQAPELGQTVKWDLFQASFLTREADNPMTGSDFDWMVSNHAVWGWKATAKASVSGVSLLQLSPFFASIFPLFAQKRLILRLFSQFSRPLCFTKHWYYKENFDADHS